MQTFYSSPEIDKLIALKAYLHDQGLVKEAGVIGDLIEGAKGAASSFWDANKAKLAKAMLLVAIGAIGRDYLEEDSITRAAVEMAEDIFESLTGGDYVIHRVEPGQNLAVISGLYYPEITQDEGIQIILDENPEIRDPGTIHPGDEIRIPKTEALIEKGEEDTEPEDEVYSGPTLSRNPARESALIAAGMAEGMEKTELAQFMAQMRKESGGFKDYKEQGGPSYFSKKDYPPYIGRGPMQLTWEYNYRNFGKADGVGDLYVEQPELVEGDEVGARAAVWFWTNSEGGNIRSKHGGDFTDTKAITRTVNGSSGTWRERNKYFKEYLEILP
jgi:predicted chitinase